LEGSLKPSIELSTSRILVLQFVLKSKTGGVSEGRTTPFEGALMR